MNKTSRKALYLHVPPKARLPMTGKVHFLTFHVICINKTSAFGFHTHLCVKIKTQKLPVTFKETRRKRFLRNGKRHTELEQKF